MHEYKLAARQEGDISSFAAIGLRACFCGRIKDLIIVDDVNYYPKILGMWEDHNNPRRNYPG
jgi:hypothetical protein